ncbi:MAG: copper-translocating P-type ATPase [Armatimonadetes bacterium]|nr:copper-translocating P-type ATPase [Armatimonadota bacterium]
MTEQERHRRAEEHGEHSTHNDRASEEKGPSVPCHHTGEQEAAHHPDLTANDEASGHHDTQEHVTAPDDHEGPRGPLHGGDPSAGHEHAHHPPHSPHEGHSPRQDHEEHEHPLAHRGHGTGSADAAHAGHHGHQEHTHPGGHQVHEDEDMEASAGHAGHKEHEGHDARAGHGGHAAGSSHHPAMVADYRRRFWISLAITLPVLALSPMLRKLVGFEPQAFAGADYLLAFLATVIYTYGGFPFLRGLVREVRSGQPGMMTLIGTAITAAFAYSVLVTFGYPGKTFFWELATLIDIMLLGHWIEMKSVMGASRALEELAKLMPETAHAVQEDGSLRDVPVSSLKPGDRVLIRPGEQAPADGVVVEGTSSVNEAMLTGESTPVEKSAGDTVIAGSINGEGALTIEVQNTGDATYLSQVVRLVQQAQQSKSRSQDLANRAAFWLTMIALTAGAATLVVWLLLGKGLDFALERSITVMVITCPHALGLAVPLVVAVSTALAARRGLLVRDRLAFERARLLDAVVFDKTGTLTLGRFGLEAVAAAEGYEADQVLALAAAVEAASEHPLARAINDAAVDRALDVPAVSEFRAIPGKGVRGQVAGHTVAVVSPAYLREHGLDPAQLQDLRGPGRTVVYVVRDRGLIGAIAAADVLRPESHQAVAELRRLGLQVMMLTGDNEQVAQWVAAELGLDEYFAEVLPGDKAAKISEIQQRGLTVAMVGDGVNDAPALAQADVGVAIGAGTNVAIESADAVLVRNDPRNVADMLHLSRATWRKMVQNLAWATGYNVLAIPLAAGVLYSWGLLLSPAMGAVLMSASTVIVAINARLLSLPRSADAPPAATA